MSYCSVDQLKDYLGQLAGTSDYDAVLEQILDRATAYIDTRLGYSFGTSGTDTRTVYGDGTPYLSIPDAGGTVTEITTLDGYTVPAYVEQDGVLTVTTDTGVLTPFSSPYGLTYTALRYYPVWLPGVPYTVAATYGTGDVPDAIVECCLQIAVRLWRFRETGGSEVVGTEAGATTDSNGESPFVKTVLDSYATTSTSVGVW